MEPQTAKAPPLDISMLKEIECGLKKSYLECLSDAASVCLHQAGHAPGVSMAVTGETPTDYCVFWNEVTPELERTWADRDDTTEHGAYGVAFLVLNDAKNLIAVERSAKENGFDYWVGSKRETLFQNKARLEVSGIRTGRDSSIQARAEEKVSRLRKYKHPLPAIVAITEFGGPRVHILEIHGRNS